MSGSFVTPWTIAHQAPLSMEFSRQKYWSSLPFPSPGAFSDPRDQTQVSELAGRFFTTEPPEKTGYRFLREQKNVKTYSYD